MIRKFAKTDKDTVLELLELNTPEFFAPSEEKDFVEYLELHAQNYYVVERSGTVIGCGGFNFGFEEGKTVRISWDIIHPDFQGKGVGKELLLYRINEIKKNTTITKIEVRTTQLAYNFYQKSGFQLVKRESDFWAKGFDLYQMKLELAALI